MATSHSRQVYQSADIMEDKNEQLSLPIPKTLERAACPRCRGTLVNGPVVDNRGRSYDTTRCVQCGYEKHDNVVTEQPVSEVYEAYHMYKPTLRVACEGGIGVRQRETNGYRKRVYGECPGCHIVVRLHTTKGYRTEPHDLPVVPR